MDRIPVAAGSLALQHGLPHGRGPDAQHLPAARCHYLPSDDSACQLQCQQVGDCKVSVLYTAVSASGSVENPPLPIYAHADIDILLGQHVNFTFDPILRTVFVPDTKFNFICDTVMYRIK